jgi:hypothetical protein
MKRVSIKMRGIEYKDCYFIDSLDSYKEYISELNNKFAVSESEIKNIKTFVGHGYSMLTGISGMLEGMPADNDEVGRNRILCNLKCLHATVLCNQLEDILNGKKLVINKKGGYFPIKIGEEYEIIENESTPYTEKDIKLKKWWGGNHYYAKVGNIDVVDSDGNVKWNNESTAMEKAKQFLLELNN